MYKVGSHNSFGLNRGALEDYECSPSEKGLWPKKYLCTWLFGETERISTLKALTSPAGKRNRIHFVELSRCQVHF